MKKKLFSLLIVVIFLFASFGLAKAQDPGVPDTVRFEQWGTYIPCPLCSGTAVVPMVVFTDEELYSMEIPLRLSGPATFDSGRFFGDRAWFFEEPGAYGYFGIPEDSQAMVIGVGSFSPDFTMPPGDGIFAHIYLTVKDTGYASIDETVLPPGFVLHFFDVYHHWITPVFLKAEFFIEPQDVLPGDVDDNDLISLSDVIYLANYILKGGLPPVFTGSADVNTDCQVNLSDVILIAQWYFTGQIPLQPGCAY